MLPTDREMFVRVLNGLAAIRRVELTKEAVEMWWGAMRHWQIEAFKIAAEQLLRTCQFMPTPYDFEQLALAEWPTAAEAWLGYDGDDQDVLQIIDQCEAMVFGDLRRGLVQNDEMPWRQKRWIEAYNEMIEARKTRCAAEPMLRLNGNTKRIIGGLKRIGEVMGTST